MNGASPVESPYENADGSMDTGGDDSEVQPYSGDTYDPSTQGTVDTGQKMPEMPDTPRVTGGSTTHLSVSTSALKVFADNLETIADALGKARNQLDQVAPIRAGASEFAEAQALANKITGADGDESLQQNYLGSLAALRNALIDTADGIRQIAGNYSTIEEVNEKAGSDLSQLLQQAQGDIQKVETATGNSAASGMSGAGSGESSVDGASGTTGDPYGASGAGVYGASGTTGDPYGASGTTGDPYGASGTTGDPYGASGTTGDPYGASGAGVYGASGTTGDPSSAYGASGTAGDTSGTYGTGSVPTTYASGGTGYPSNGGTQTTSSGSATPDGTAAADQSGQPVSPGDQSGQPAAPASSVGVQPLSPGDALRVGEGPGPVVHPSQPWVSWHTDGGSGDALRVGEGPGPVVHPSQPWVSTHTDAGSQGMSPRLPAEPAVQGTGVNDPSGEASPDIDSEPASSTLLHRGVAQP
ncbi:hypothetical protein [Streptomyces sp. 8L]|uniref:hypothetical protein n=1 Tax=Streptomyces sp. 8L TaxID=2877242 RepID=UPI001CD80EF8|nr:hypothetical protein [Streptomyces sp. 8L]MCA1217017.1 hypothetical protein [Streptomyces sp. 8L]